MAGEEELPALLKRKKPALSIVTRRRLRKLIARDYLDQGKSVQPRIPVLKLRCFNGCRYRYPYRPQNILK